MLLLNRIDVYADYGTFALTPSTPEGFEFPTDMMSEDIERGYHVRDGSLIVYLPDLENFEVIAEIYLNDWPQTADESDSAFVTDLTVIATAYTVEGLLDGIEVRATFEIAPGLYECSARGFFSDEGNLFQFLLRPKN